MKRSLSVFFIVAAALMSLLGTATADTATAGAAAADRPAAASDWTVAPAADISAQVLSCTSGNSCAWPVIDGSSSRCSWTNADADWWNAPVTCSWSRTRPVKALFNNGTSATYEGVCYYRGANYTSFEIFLYQGDSATNSTGVILRSHRWVRPGQPC